MIYRDSLKLYAAKAIQFMWKFKRVEVERLKAKRIL